MKKRDKNKNKYAISDIQSGFEALKLTPVDYTNSSEFEAWKRSFPDYARSVLKKLNIDSLNSNTFDNLIDTASEVEKNKSNAQFINHLGTISNIGHEIVESQKEADSLLKVLEQDLQKLRKQEAELLEIEQLLKEKAKEGKRK